MSKVLIFGASGLVGTQLTLIASRDHSVVAACNTRRPSCINSIKVDATKMEDVVRSIVQVAPDSIIYAAGLQHASKENMDLVNAGAMISIASAANEVGSRVLYLSSDAVYCGTMPPYYEDSPVNPVSDYGKSKLFGEQMTAKCNNFCVARLALVKQNPLPKTPFSNEYRTPVDINFACEAMVRLATERTPHKVYNVGGPERMSRSQLVANITGFAVEGTICEDASRPTDCSMDSSRLNHFLRGEEQCAG